MNKGTLFGKTITELEQIVADAAMPAFTAKQIAQWLYQKRAATIDDITNLSKKAREQLSLKYDMGVGAPVGEVESVDGTKKYLFRANNLFVESAYIPDENRKTLCVSSQVGCKMNCTFCMTGKQGFQGQLTASEILNQIRSISESEQLTNVVYMGMGEPLDNYGEVMKSIDILTSEWGYGRSPRRINLSTVGIMPAMKRFVEESEVHLAISLHSPFHSERRELMPVESAYPIAETVTMLRNYDFSGQRRLSFEYIMFAGINDTPAHVKGIAKLLNGLRCRINLIKFHAIPDSSLCGSAADKMVWFANQLNQKGFIATIRRSRGEDIQAACGLLSTNASP
ncbi:MAG: 23S rRNA (adenine(2503)-C(2))-methyltransferase RlmN, partial [Cytophagaceae bacterium]|nr:23S rRNA (adenine(2503)-C(2))-methyltransferase RlmN [Cytophagaceae bacterium]